MRRDRFLRVAAIGLVVYGLFGFALLALAYSVASQTFAQLEALGRSVDQERLALSGSLRSTSQTLDATSGSFDGFGTTLGQAKTSSLQAAQFARDLGDTMAQMSAASNVNILGFQPLAGMGQGFDRAGQQLAGLGTDLEQTGQALGRNVDDVATIETSLVQARAQVDAVARAFDAASLPGTQPELMRPFELAIYGLLLWLGCQALVSIVIGVMLFHRSHLRLRAHHAERRAAARAAHEIVNTR
jgi:hypothetical protein